MVQLQERAGWQKACVALEHKHARIVWAMLAKGMPFDSKHASTPPGIAPTFTGPSTQTLEVVQSTGQTGGRSTR